MYFGPYPSLQRTLLGFLVAPMVGALPLILLGPGGLVQNLLLYVPLAYVHTLLFSLPLFLWLRHKRVAPTFLNCIMAAAASVALPWFLAGFFLALFVALSALVVAPLGALGGAAFWLTSCRNSPGAPLVAAEIE